MNISNPVYTESAECQDCYKCVRNCPVKAIKIENDTASVIPELCILCGRCVEVCPVEAKKVRNDIQRAKNLLKIKDKVIVSLAPSFLSEFSKKEEKQLCACLKKLGFYGVSETALGAEEVSANLAEYIDQSDKNIFISSACPTVVKYIEIYKPELVRYITPLLSPLLTHCKMLRKEYGDDIGVVFAGPCISKKSESDEHQDLLNIALSFDNLRKWFEEEGIELDKTEINDEDCFLPPRAKEGSLYPVDGGMIVCTKNSCKKTSTRFVSVSGIDQVELCLEDLDKLNNRDESVFLELMACEGGCINGPLTHKQDSVLIKRMNVIDSSEYKRETEIRKSRIDIRQEYLACAENKSEFTEEQIEEVLRRTGKRSRSDEKNCSGCGYNNCREFAEAVLSGKAEISMCVTYMREMAYKKANRLIETMPSGVVIADESLRIVECNRNFVEMTGRDSEYAFEARPGLEGALLDKLISFSDLFAKVLKTGIDIPEKTVKTEKGIFLCSIFSIEKNHIAGGIIQDITNPSVKKNEIINKTREVIQKNLLTVQKIAYLLGENASETEITLNSIIESFSTEREE